MTTSITITPEYSPSLSPAQAGKHQAPNIVNNDFLKSFGDLLDVINPLQHIPVVSTIYRELTGDTISAGAQIAGGALFGGIFGFGASIINAIVENETGKDIGANVYAAVSGNYQKTSELS